MVIFAILFSIISTVANAQALFGGSGSTPPIVAGCQSSGTASADGCANAPASGLANASKNIGRNTFFGTGSPRTGGYAQQSGQTYASIPAWNVAGVDYVVGIPSTVTLKDPANIASDSDPNVAAHCTFSSTYTHCSGTTDLVIDGYDFGCNGGVGKCGGQNGSYLYIDTTVTGNVTIKNSKFTVGPGTWNGTAGMGFQSAEINNGGTVLFKNNYVDGKGLNYANGTSFESNCTKANYSAFTGSISGTTLTISAVSVNNGFAVGQPINGTGVTNSYVTGSQTTITGVTTPWNGTTGVYSVSPSQTVASTAMDSLSGGRCAGNGIIRTSGSGATTLEYNVFINGPGRHWTDTTNADFTARYNYLENSASNFANGAHGDAIYRGATSGTTSLVTYKYNTFIEPNNFTGTTGELMTAIGSYQTVTTATIENNVSIVNHYSANMVSPSYLTGGNLATAAGAYVGGVVSTNTVNINNNYTDPTGASYCHHKGAAFALTANMLGNVNLRDGGSITGLSVDGGTTTYNPAQSYAGCTGAGS